MLVTLIKPTLGRTADGTRFIDDARMEPLQLGLLGGLTPPGVDVRLLDDRIDTIDYDEPSDLVAITVETFTARRAYEIAVEYRARKVPVVMGGMHVTLLPDEVAEYADSIVTGDAEAVWASIVRDAHEGTLQPRYHGAFGTPQPGSVPRRELYEGKGYLPLSLLQFGRGCVNRCEYCAVTEYFGHHHYARPAAEVVREIESQGLRDLFFVDSLTTPSSACRSIAHKLGVPFAQRTHFLDVEKTEDSVVRQLCCLLDEAVQQGGAIGIAHPSEEALAALPKVSAAFAEKGVRLVPLSEMVAKHHSFVVADQGSGTGAQGERVGR